MKKLIIPAAVAAAIGAILAALIANRRKNGLCER